MSASNSSHCRRIAAPSSGEILSPGAWGKRSNRSSWRRVRSMNARPSRKVIVAVVSAKPRTAESDIKTSHTIAASCRTFCDTGCYRKDAFLAIGFSVDIAAFREDEKYPRCITALDCDTDPQWNNGPRNATAALKSDAGSSDVWQFELLSRSESNLALIGDKSIRIVEFFSVHQLSSFSSQVSVEVPASGNYVRRSKKSEPGRLP
jgi:hypothetical protein